MADLLDYGAPEDSVPHVPVDMSQRLQPPGSKYYALPSSLPPAPDYGPSDPADILVDAEQLAPINPEEDMTPVPDQPDGSVALSIGIERVRFSVLHVFGAPITQLSTSRLFSWLVEWGASPVAIEWVNDFSCNVIFHDAVAALRGLKHIMLPPTREEWERAAAQAQREKDEAFTFGIPLPKAEDVMTFLAELNASKHEKSEGESMEPSEGVNPEASEPPQAALDQSRFEALGVSLLTSRKLRAVPLKIYSPKERDAGRRLLKKRQKDHGATAEPVPDTEMTDVDPEMDVRRTEPGFNSSHLPPPPSTLPSKPDFDLDDMIKLTSTMYARFSVADFDQKQKGARDQSEWYRLHGEDAGKRVVPLLNVGERGSKKDIRDRELLELPELERRMMTAPAPRGVRDRSASPGRGESKGDDVLASLGQDAIAGGIRIRGRGTVRAPDDELISQVRGRGRGARTQAFRDDEDEEAGGGALLEAEKVEQRKHSVPAPHSDAPQGRDLQDRLNTRDLGSRVSGAGPSLLDRLGGENLLAPAANKKSRRRGRW